MAEEGRAGCIMKHAAGQPPRLGNGPGTIPKLFTGPIFPLIERIRTVICKHYNDVNILRVGFSSYRTTET